MTNNTLPLWGLSDEDSQNTRLVTGEKVSLRNVVYPFMYKERPPMLDGNSLMKIPDQSRNLCNQNEVSVQALFVGILL
jgi:hypothetical protein